MIVACTGHRPHKLNLEYGMDGPVSLGIEKKFQELLTRYKATYAISGMALGADMIFCRAALGLGIPVLAAIPFKGQECRWPELSQRLYKNLLDHPSVMRHEVSPEGYSRWKMQRRNIFMVNACDLLIAVWDGSRGGTANCIEYAQKTECPVEFVDVPLPYEIQTEEKQRTQGRPDRKPRLPWVS